MNYGQHSSFDAAFNCHRYTCAQTTDRYNDQVFYAIDSARSMHPLTVQQLHLHGTEYETVQAVICCMVTS